MDYKIELFRPFRFRTGKGDIKQVEPGTYSIPEDMPDAAGQLAVAQGVAQVTIVYQVQLSQEMVEPTYERVELSIPQKRKYTRKKPAPSNKSRNVPENKSALAS